MHKKDRLEKTAPMLVLFAGVCWGVLGIFTKNIAAFGIDSMQTTMLRALLTAMLMVVVLAVVRPSLLRIHLRDLWMFLGTGICSIVFFNTCYFAAIERTSMAVASILLYTAPGIVLVFSIFLFHEKPDARKIAALVLAFLGCITVSGIFGGSENAVNLPGFLLGLGAGLGYALYTVVGNFALKKYNPITVTVYTFLIAALATLPFTRPQEVAEAAVEHPQILIYGVMLSVVSTIFPFVAYTVALQYMEAGKASIMASVEPIAASVAGILLFGEKLTGSVVCGLILVFAAVVLLNSGKQTAQETDSGQRALTVEMDDVKYKEQNGMI